MKSDKSIQNVPQDVLWVWSIQMHKEPIGAEAYSMAQRIIDKYPEYFEWEHKYKAVPQEVHDAFLKECYPERYLPTSYERYLSSGAGLIPLIRRQQAEAATFKPMTIKSFDELLASLHKHEKEKWDRWDRIRRIWDKYYSVYGLECRE